MSPTPDLARHLRWPVLATHVGMLAERATRAFWPVWTVLALTLAPVLMGWHERVSPQVVLGFLACAGLAALVTLALGIRAFRWPPRAEAVDRVDSRLPGRPIAALSDTQAIGAGDSESQAVWRAHLRRMSDRTRDARSVDPDLRVSDRDPFGLRYMALVFLCVGLLFGSLWRVSTVAETAQGGGQVLSMGPVWEGWVEPPTYTGKPSLYLNDITRDRLRVAEGSRVTLRLYGESGALTVTESVSDRPAEEIDAAAPQQFFDIQRAGDISVEGEGGRTWQIALAPDAVPTVEPAGEVTTEADGTMSLPFRATDDYGVVAGTATFTLDLDSIDRSHGLGAAPDPREPLIVDLPMPFSGDRADFEEALIDDFSQHPWANLPVTLVLQVSDARDQVGTSEPVAMSLPGRRFFQPIARAIIEQRRDLLWSTDNAPRIAMILRAVTHRGTEFFPNAETYAATRDIITKLETPASYDLTDESIRDELAQEMWDLALELEEGALADARQRLERAQQRLEEAMRNGASDEEIAELMQEMREAMDEYMQMLADQAEPRDGNGTDQPDSNQETREFTMDELQALMDRIEELMQEGRMAEAMELMEQLNQLMENLEVTEGEGGQNGPRSPGQQSMEDLGETLRDQQQLNDESFRELQDEFNGRQGQQQQGQQQPGQQPGQQGQDPGQQGQQGQGLGQGGDPRQGEQGDGGAGGEGSLADRQRALRQQLDALRQNLPGLPGAAGDAARDALDRAERAMEGAEDALRDGDMGSAIDRQAEAMDALREGMRNLGQALAENQQQQEPGQGQQEGNAQGQPSEMQRDPLGRESGNGGRLGSEQSLLQDEVRRRAEELLGEIRRRSAEQDRSEKELDYLGRLLDRF